MIDDRLFLYGLLIFIFLVFSIRTGEIFLRRRTKYNLVQLILLIILLLSGIFSFFLPGKLNLILTKLLTFISDSPSVHYAIRISILVIFALSLIAFFYYPNMKRFLARRKGKYK